MACSRIGVSSSGCAPRCRRRRRWRRVTPPPVGIAPAGEHGVRRAGLAAWQALALAAQAAAEQYGALLQPCGDAVMLVFGAFEDRPSRQSLHDALAAADLIQRSWRAN